VAALIVEETDLLPDGAFGVEHLVLTTNRSVSLFGVGFRSRPLRLARTSGALAAVIRK
jgi:hypothetical protein